MFDSETVSAQLSRLKKLKQDADLLKSHLQVYNEKMEEQKRCREFTQFIIEKHNIDTSKPVEVSNGEKHVMTCNEDYNAYLTYTENRFFEREKASTRGFKEANELIKNIIEKVTAREELQVLGRLIEQLMPPKMQRVFLQKAQNYLRVDFNDPAVFIQVDSAQYGNNSTSFRPSSDANLSQVSPITSLPNLHSQQSLMSPTSLASQKMSIDKGSAGKKGKMRLSSNNSRNTAHIVASASEAQLTNRKAA